MEEFLKRLSDHGLLTEYVKFMNEVREGCIIEYDSVSEIKEINVKGSFRAIMFALGEIAIESIKDRGFSKEERDSEVHALCAHIIDVLDEEME